VSARIVLWTASKRIETLVDDALAALTAGRPTYGKRTPAFETVKPTGPRDLPGRAAFVVTSGSAKTAERFAWQFGAMVLVLPEAGDYLLGKARDAAPGDPLVLVGYDLRQGK
jgi:hypothetical protein